MALGMMISDVSLIQLSVTYIHVSRELQNQPFIYCKCCL